MVDICRMKGIRHVVVSPGSRNAPLSVLFSRDDSMQLFPIVDERCAAFFALGLAQQIHQPVALLCTSGTAVLNYAPAIAEAYYQQVPLLVLTADRPPELLDTSDGQMINQQDIFKNIVMGSYTYPLDGPDHILPWHQRRIINEAIDRAKIWRRPVHVNVPMREPLYNLDNLTNEVKSTSYIFPITASLPEQDLIALSNQWNKSDKIMLLIGCHRPSKQLNEIIEKFNELENLVIVTETTSNVLLNNTIKNIDIVLSNLKSPDKEYFKPDLLITFGTNLISKQIKLFLREFSPKAHWHLSPILFFPDSFRCLTHKIGNVPMNFLNNIFSYLENKPSEYKIRWMEQKADAIEKARVFIDTLPYCDLKVFETILQFIPSGSNLQMGNSMPVRYCQFLPPREDITYNANRGTSGIDGCVSTAVGAATALNTPVTLVVGDLSFMYDSNALWSRNHPANLKIIVINNQGGNIFRFIPGPDEFEEFETLFEAKHKHDFEHLAYHYGVPYERAPSIKSLEKSLKRIYEEPGCHILEVITPGEINGQILRNLFNYLKKGSNEEA